MTPEQIAADRIARAVEKATGSPMNLSLPIGEAAVNYIAAAGLVVVQAGRMAQLLAIREAALALAQSEASMEAQMRGQDVTGLWEPWPEADALVAALKATP
jgi:hypothetical protein